MAPSAHSPSTNSKRIGSPSVALRSPGRNCGSQARFRGGPAGKPFNCREAAILLVGAADEGAAGLAAPPAAEPFEPARPVPAADGELCRRPGWAPGGERSSRAAALREIKTSAAARARTMSATTGKRFIEMRNRCEDQAAQGVGVRLKVFF